MAFCLRHAPIPSGKTLCVMTKQTFSPDIHEHILNHDIKLQNKYQTNTRITKSHLRKAKTSVFTKTSAQ